MSNRIPREPAALLLAMAFVMPLTFSVWNALLNNFAVEQIAFTGRDIGILQSLREIPGFLTFTVVFLLLVIREQRLALLSLLLMSAGVAITGYFPTLLGLYITTVIMSIGFHYFEALNESLTCSGCRNRTPPTSWVRYWPGKVWRRCSPTAASGY